MQAQPQAAATVLQSFWLVYGPGGQALQVPNEQRFQAHVVGLYFGSPGIHGQQALPPAETTICPLRQFTVAPGTARAASAALLPAIMTPRMAGGV